MKELKDKLLSNFTSWFLKTYKKKLELYYKMLLLTYGENINREFSPYLVDGSKFDIDTLEIVLLDMSNAIQSEIENEPIIDNEISFSGLFIKINCDIIEIEEGVCEYEFVFEMGFKEKSCEVLYLSTDLNPSDCQ